MPCFHGFPTYPLKKINIALSTLIFSFIIYNCQYKRLILDILFSDRNSHEFFLKKIEIKGRPAVKQVQNMVSSDKDRLLEVICLKKHSSCAFL